MNLRFWEEKKQTQLDAQIDSVYVSMGVYGPDSPEYKKLLKHLERLQKLKTSDRQRKSASPDTKWSTLGSLAGIAVIVIYESKHVWMSKAAGLIKKF